MSVHPETRASLILRIQNAEDMAAWDEFVELYLPVIGRVAARRGLQPADADNVAQEVLLRVARSISSWLARTDRGPFRAWLRKIARNETVSLLTRQATRPFLQFDSRVDGGAENLVDHDLDSELDLDYQKEVFLWAAEQVREAVAEKTWQAFWLTQIEGLSVAEVAQRLSVRPGHIYFGRSRVMQRLKQIIQQFEDA